MLLLIRNKEGKERQSDNNVADETLIEVLDKACLIRNGFYTLFVFLSLIPLTNFVKKIFTKSDCTKIISKVSSKEQKKIKLRIFLPPVNKTIVKIFHVSRTFHY